MERNGKKVETNSLTRINANSRQNREFDDSLTSVQVSSNTDSNTVISSTSYLKLIQICLA